MYDSANQLIRENRPQENKTWTWTYDGAGNILSKSEYDYTTGELEKTTNYTYGDSAWGDLLTSYDGKAITYDEIGNPLNDGRRTYTWERGRQAASINGDIRYYNCTGMLVEVVGNNWYTYSYRNGRLVNMNVSVGADVHQMDITYDANGMPMTLNCTSSYYDEESGDEYVYTDTYYYLLNPQGDVIGLTNITGDLIVSYNYDAWGKLLSVNYGSGISQMDRDIADYNPLRYRGYIYDVETGLYYVSSRYYDPEIGRWINADDTAYLGADGTLLSYNLFAYCKNNPVMGYDPSGTFDWGSLAQGGGWLATGVAALVVGVSVLTCGVATPLMVGVALATAGAGALTVVNGASEIGEAFTGYNVVRDGVFQGNATVYNAYAYSTAAVAQVGTAICGGWSAQNAPRIEAYNNIQNYKYADGAATHIGQRSYYDSTLLQKQIIKYGSMTSEGNGVYTFRVAGSSFNAARQLMHQGTWELTTINSMKLIGHFLLDY